MTIWNRGVLVLILHRGVCHTEDRYRCTYRSHIYIQYTNENKCYIANRPQRKAIQDNTMQ
jgi:hypothetical protein